MNHEAKKILIIKWGALGDILACVPTLVKIREKFPNAHITLLSSNIAKDIFASSLIVDKIYNRKGFDQQLNFFQSILFLRREKFDIVFNLKWGSESADIFALLSNATVKVGASKKRYLRVFYDYKPQFLEDDFNTHEYVKNFNIATSYLSFDNPTLSSYIYIDKKDSDSIDSFLKTNDIKEFMVISPSASTLKKAWDSEKYIKLAQYIIENSSYKIVATYSPNDYEYTQNIVKKIGKNCYLSPETTINQVASLVQQSQLCICNNSGIMHIAYAVNTPVACFNTSIGWRPFAPHDISIDRIPEDILDNRSLSNEQVQDLLSSISVNEAIKKLKNFLSVK